MTTEEQRAFILEKYPGSEAWKARISRMKADQVHAFYSRLVSQKSFVPVDINTKRRKT